MSALEQRRELYRRYASVVDEQESALEEGDLDRFSELNITRRAIEAEVDAVHFSPEVVPDRATLDAAHRAAESAADHVYLPLSQSHSANHHDRLC